MAGVAHSTLLVRSESPTRRRALLAAAHDRIQVL
jgi:hypothetical protein